MTQQIGTQGLETSGVEESWQAFFAVSDPTAVKSLDEWTADQLLRRCYSEVLTICRRFDACSPRC